MNDDSIPAKQPSSHSLPIYEKLSFASGSITYGFAYYLFSSLAYPVLNMTLGMSAVFIGAALAIGRLWDAVTDPLIGSMSDNCRARMGRRKPFILVGAITLFLIGPLVWMVPQDWGDWGMFAWFTVTSLLFYLAGTLFNVPWLSLSYEMSPDPVERTKIHAYRAYFGAGVGMILFWMWSWCQADIFGDPVTGAIWVTFGFGLAGLICAMPTLLFCKERFGEKARKQEKIGVVRAVKETLSNRSFLVFELGIVSVLLGAPMMVGALGQYVNAYYIYDNDIAAGARLSAVYGTVFIVAKLITIPIAVHLSGRFGKIPVLRWCLIFGFFGSASAVYFARPDMPHLILVTAALLSPPFAAFWLMVDPIKADCADYDEWKTGLRREGSYASIANWLEKVIVSLVLLLSGVILAWTGYDPELTVQPGHVPVRMLLLYCFVPATGFLIALFSLRWYTLTDEYMAGIRKELSQRRGEI